jgi:hypothetical protein
VQDGEASGERGRVLRGRASADQVEMARGDHAAERNAGVTVTLVTCAGQHRDGLRYTEEIDG